MTNPTCFISYAWENDAHKDWVRYLARGLRKYGVEAKLDQWDQDKSADLPTYMEICIRESEFVLPVCTPTFAEKANKGVGGVGYEKNIIAGELFEGVAAPIKLIPILRSGDPKVAIPSYLKAFRYVDFRDDAAFPAQLEQLLRIIHKTPETSPPPVELKPDLPPKEEPDIPALPCASPPWRGPDTAIRALHQIPPPPADFSGRVAELDDLRAAFGRGFRIFSVRGLGGVGKTALALKWAQELKAKYPDAQLYVNLRASEPQPLSVADALAHFIHAYYPSGKLPESLDELQATYHSVLDGQRAVIILDNAADAKQVEPLLPPDGCALLVTSRRRFHLPGLHPLDLNALLEADACAMLLAISPRVDQAVPDGLLAPLRELGVLQPGQAEPEPRLCSALARLCGRLPIALRLAGAALAEHRDRSVVDYVRRLCDAKARLKLVEASFSTSYDLLSDDAKTRWAMLSVFPGDFDQTAAAAVWGMTVELAKNPLSSLVALNLVDWNEQDRRYRLHALGRVFAHSRLSPVDEPAAALRHAAEFDRVAGAALVQYLQGGQHLTSGLAWFDQEWGNIQAGHAWLARLFVHYALSAAPILIIRLHGDERIAWFKAAAAAADTIGDSESRAWALAYLGESQRLDDEAKAALESFEAGLSVAGTDKQGQIAAYCHEGIGHALHQMDSYPESQKHFNQAQSLYEKLGDRRGKARCLDGKGAVLWYIDEQDKARIVYEEALVIARELGDWQLEAHARWGIGTVHLALSEYAQSEGCFRHALALSQEVRDRFGEEKCLWRLGTVYLALGQYEKAKKVCDEAGDIARQIRDKSAELNCTWIVGETLFHTGHFAEARKCYWQAVRMCHEIGDIATPGHCIRNLGNVHLALAEYGSARRCFRKALALCENVGDRQGQANALRGFGDTAVLLGEYDEAHAWYQRALTMYRRIRDREGEAAALSGLGHLRARTGEPRSGAKLLRQALKIAGEIGTRAGEGRYLAGLGSLEVAVGDANKGITHAKQALLVAGEVGDRVGEVMAWNTLGKAHHALKEYLYAIEAHRQSQAIARDIGCRREEADAAWNWSLSMWAVGDRASAIASAQASLETLTRTGAPDAQTVRDQLEEWRGAPLAEVTRA